MVFMSAYRKLKQVYAVIFEPIRYYYDLITTADIVDIWMRLTVSISTSDVLACIRYIYSETLNVVSTLKLVIKNLFDSISISELTKLYLRITTTVALVDRIIMNFFLTETMNITATLVLVHKRIYDAISIAELTKLYLRIVTTITLVDGIIMNFILTNTITITAGLRLIHKNLFDTISVAEQIIFNFKPIIAITAGESSLIKLFSTETIGNIAILLKLKLQRLPEVITVTDAFTTYNVRIPTSISATEAITVMGSSWDIITSSGTFTTGGVDITNEYIQELSELNIE